MDNEAALNANYSLDMILLPPIRIRNGKILKSAPMDRPISRRVGASKKLYVGNLSFGTTEADLRSLFSEYGVVSQIQIIMDRDRGRSRGFGFVDFAAFEEGVFDSLNEVELHGRRLTISEAKPRELR